MKQWSHNINESTAKSMGANREMPIYVRCILLTIISQKFFFGYTNVCISCQTYFIDAKQYHHHVYSTHIVSSRIVAIIKQSNFHILLNGIYESHLRVVWIKRWIFMFIIWINWLQIKWYQFNREIVQFRSLSKPILICAGIFE